MSEPSEPELVVKVAALEERKNTKQAEYEIGLARVEGRMAAAFQGLESRLQA